MNLNRQIQPCSMWIIHRSYFLIRVWFVFKLFMRLNLMYFSTINQIKILCSSSIKFLCGSFYRIVRRFWLKMIATFVCKCKSILMDGDGIWFGEYYTKRRVQKFCIQWQIFIMFIVIYIVNEIRMNVSFVYSSFRLDWCLLWWSYVWKSLPSIQNCSQFSTVLIWWTDGNLSIDDCSLCIQTRTKIGDEEKNEVKRLDACRKVYKIISDIIISLK